MNSKIAISNIYVDYFDSKINYDTASRMCESEMDKIRASVYFYDTLYNTKSEKCFLVKHSYGKPSGADLQSVPCP